MLVPLSYGRVDYAETIEPMLQGLGFKRIDILSRFLPLPDYNAVTGRCGTAIFNAKRQHALGNIGAALCRGARVFLDPVNPAFGFLRGLGASVESSAGNSDRFPTMSDSSLRSRAAANTRALNQCWGREQVENNARSFLRLVS